MKLKLTLDALTVESFETVDGQALGRGTIRGAQLSAPGHLCMTQEDCASYRPTRCNTCYSCPDTCLATCQTCQYESACAGCFTDNCVTGSGCGQLTRECGGAGGGTDAIGCTNECTTGMTA